MKCNQQKYWTHKRRKSNRAREIRRKVAEQVKSSLIVHSNCKYTQRKRMGERMRASIREFILSNQEINKLAVQFMWFAYCKCIEMIFHLLRLQHVDDFELLYCHSHFHASISNKNSVVARIPSMTGYFHKLCWAAGYSTQFCLLTDKIWY